MKNIFSDKTLLIDGDILAYKPACVFDEDSIRDRLLIQNNIDSKINKLCFISGVSNYRIFLTGKLNFRNFLVDDYKEHRKNLPKPVNLQFTRKYLINKHEAEHLDYLEADDLLSINQNDETLIWSLDKDLLQVPGEHINLTTKSIFRVTKLGDIVKNYKKYTFNGYKGFMFQMLAGDNADFIIGCGKRSGKKGLRGFNARRGIGPDKAVRLLNNCEQSIEGFHEVIKREYKEMFNDDYMNHISIQGNLLFMVKNIEGNIIDRWSIDNDGSKMDITTGKIIL